jgi:glycolate oxidase FAD binding subunit
MSPSATGAVSRLEGLVGASSAISSAERLSPYAIGRVIPAIALQPGSAEEIAEIVKFAGAEGLAIVPCGARTKLSIGMPPVRYDVALDLTRLDKIAAYDPGDLTLSVEPGILLRNLHRSLGEHGQSLPLGAPFLTRATVGGTIASGVDGPMRQFYGTARDFVLGMEFVTGDGVSGKSGGRVVKNVTGYDMHKPMIGSLGTLAVLTKINFRTFPAPQSLRGFVAHFTTAQDATACRDAVAASVLRPLTFEIFSPSAAALFSRSSAAISDSNPNALPGGLFSPTAWTLATSFAAETAVLNRCENDLRKITEAAGATHFAQVGKDAGHQEPLHLGAVFQRVREFVPIALESSPACTIVKMSVVPQHLEHAIAAAKHSAEDHSLPWVLMARGVGVIYVALLPAARDDHSMNCVASAANRIQSDCARLGGHSTIPWCPDEWKSALKIWGAEREDLPLMRKLKSVFDPRGILAPGRFVGGI